jgi:uncharacterized protein (TIGR03435 family)
VLRPRLVQVYVIACALAGIAGAQTDGTQRPPTFEVASIKLNSTFSGNMFLSRKAGGQLEGTNVTLRMLFRYAYDVRDHEISNLPAWADTEHFDIFAKPSDEESAKEGGNTSTEAFIRNLRLRTQSLLTERFGLTLHTEMKEMQVYHLVQAKGGSKVTPTTQTPDSAPEIAMEDRRVKCRKITMQKFSDTVLASRMSRSVIDKTGLTGEFDFEMHFVPDEVVAKDPTAQAADFLTALQEQLGLRLEAAKGPVKILVIDKVARPSAN